MSPVVRFALVVLTVTLGVGGCDGDDDASPPRVTVTRPTTSTTTVAADPYAIPATIDVAYVQRVIDKLFEIEAEAAAEVVAAGELVPTAAEKLANAFVGDQLDRELEKWSLSVANGLDGIRRPPGPLVVKVVELIRADRECIHAATEVDVGQRFVEQKAVVNLATVLRPSGNVTGWAVRLQAAGGDSGEPLEFDPCAGA